MSRHRRRPREYNPEEFEKHLNMVEGHTKLVKTIFKPFFIGVGGLIFLGGVVTLAYNLLGLGDNPDTTNGLIVGGGMMAISTLFVIVANFIFNSLGQSIKRVKKVHQQAVAQASDEEFDDDDEDELVEESIPGGTDSATILRLANRTPRSIPFAVMARIYLAGFWNQFGILFSAIALGKLAFWVMMLEDGPTIMKLVVAGVAMLPAIGLAFWAKALVDAVRNSSLLKEGTIVGAKFVSIKPTGASINERQVMKLTFQFDGPDDESIKCEVNTSTPEQFSRKEIEYAIYKPTTPRNCVMLKGVSGSPIIGRNGEWQTSTSTKPLLIYCIAPVLSIAAIGFLITSLMTLLG